MGILSAIGNQSAEIDSSNNKLFLLSITETNYFNANSIAPHKNEVDSDVEEITFSVYTDTASIKKYRLNGEGDHGSHWFRTIVFNSIYQYVLFYMYGSTSYGIDANLACPYHLFYVCNV